MFELVLRIAQTKLQPSNEGQNIRMYAPYTQEPYRFPSRILHFAVELSAGLAGDGSYFVGRADGTICELPDDPPGSFSSQRVVASNDEAPVVRIVFQLARYF